ncbi:MAG: 6-bladed beta-propeller, partial [Campylobacterota bacterium]
MHRSIKKRFGIIMTLMLLIGAAGLHGAKEKKLVWPTAPDPAKIEFVAMITKAEDLKIEKGFFSKIWDFVAGNEERILVKPFGLYADDEGRVFVTDTAAKALFFFDPKNNKTEIIEGSKKKSFQSPMDIAGDDRGNIYVSDSVLATIFVFDAKGEFLREIGSSHKLHRPTGIAVNKTLERLYVVDSLVSQIKVFSLKGKFIKTIGNYGADKGEFNRPTFLTIDDEGTLYVSDTMN